MRIAVIGAGIAGLSCAYALNRRHDVHVFEREPRLGGHAHTQSVVIGGQLLTVDTGFIVYNDRNYPDLIKLFAEMGVETWRSDMSFAASVDDGRIEYCGSSALSLFAQPRNALRPGFLAMLKDILRFNRLGGDALMRDELGERSLGEFLDAHDFGRYFRDCYVLPMGAAIWSTPVRDMLSFPATTFLRFFHNHGLLTVNGHPQWRTLAHRSVDYVSRIARVLRRAPIAGDPALRIERESGRLRVRLASGHSEMFDAVVLAAHADQSRAMLDPSFEQQRDYLANFRFQSNDAILHSDPGLMPKRRRAWASWNYLTSRQGDDTRVSLTYWMNRLQSIDNRFPVFVTLNPSRPPAEQLLHNRMVYDHPIFDLRSIKAQARLGEVQGRDGIWLVGAWLGYGFHEDGARSGLDVAAALGSPPSWQSSRQVNDWCAATASVA